MKTCRFLNLAVFFIIIFLSAKVKAQQLDQFSITEKENQFSAEPISNDVQFNGYTNYWQDYYNTWHRYGSLFKMANPDVGKTILQSKIDVAEDMGLPGLLMQEGFLSSLLADSYKELDNPDQGAIERALADENVLVFVDPGSEAGKMLSNTFPFDNSWPNELKSHQYSSPDL